MRFKIISVALSVSLSAEEKCGFQFLLTKEADRYGLRKFIEFGTKVAAAHYKQEERIWNITTVNGAQTTCRYFLPATGILSVPKTPEFPGQTTYTGELYQPSNWPAHKVDFEGKRIAVVGTGSTGVHLIPKLGHVAKELTVFQRTPNYVLPGRDRSIDEYEAAEIKNNFDSVWEVASQNLAGHAFKPSGRTIKGSEPSEIQRILDGGWEKGGFNFQLETFDDNFMDPESNQVVSEYVRQRIRSIVNDQNTAKLLCPDYPLGSKRPPTGHCYYEAFNRPNVKLVDVSQQNVELYTKGIRTTSGVEYEFDMIILAIGFDAGTGALNQIDITGTNGISLRESWNEKLETYAGILVPDFPNMFIVCGPHMPVGNLPTFLEPGMQWIGKTIHHMEVSELATINVSKQAAQTWSDHVEALWNSVFISKPASDNRSWFVGTNIPGKSAKIMFYFGGLPGWRSMLEDEAAKGWPDMEFEPNADKNVAKEQTRLLDHLSVTAEQLESAAIPLQSEEAGLLAEEKFNMITALCSRYIDWAVKEVRSSGLEVKQDYRRFWWKTLEEFVTSSAGQALIAQSPDTEEEITELIGQLGTEGKAVGHVGPELVRLLTGQTDPIQHILKDDLLFRIYSADEGARPNHYIAHVAKILSSKEQDLRILEIGAGTGGTTGHVLRACSPNGDPFCKQYLYTDVSAGFFKTGEAALKKWNPLLTYKKLDIELDPVQQGFEAHSFDLIITANCIHATHCLSSTLSNIHKLLKPGGVLGLVELTRLTPYFNIMFGPLEGWWAGVDEGRVESPLQSAEQWDGHLKEAGFSGIEMAVYDLPEPERHSALLLSTAIGVNAAPGEQAASTQII
jgi:cation diffusion facilitator CzcD-associated flavoprotein CzcO/SAM-dependent methyltransferase